MPLIPSALERGSAMRADLKYATYARATWEWWCKANNVYFTVIDDPLTVGVFAAMSPSFRRWLVPAMLFQRYGIDSRVALVDADTMIRWDAPDFFGVPTSGFTAALDTNPAWIHRDIQAYQHLFPGVSLRWWEYINAGVVILGINQVRLIDAFLRFASENWEQIVSVHCSGQFGTDQTPLNFMIRREKEPVCALPPPFNTIGCFPMDSFLRSMEMSPTVDWASFASTAFSRPHTFDFIEYGYIWHFTSVVRCRQLVMGETWRRVREHYPSAEIEISHVS
jgi:hypothetical protein